MSRSEVTVRLRDAPPVLFPGAATARDGVKNAVDCNSPCFWHDGLFYLFNSYAQPWRIVAPDLLHLGASEPAALRGEVDGRPLAELFVWIESIVKRPDGSLYGFLHYEPDGVCKPGEHLPTAPRIIAIRSRDLGLSWDLLGTVLEAPPDSLECATKSPWDAGGQGDFSVIVDRAEEYVYFLYSSYVRQPEEQGVGVARMPLRDLDDPVGKVRKWYRGAWSEPGLGGRTTPAYPARVDWHREDADLFWGPSIHWNTALRCYVILMSRAVDTRMTGDGTWIASTERLDDPGLWKAPRRIVTAEEARGYTQGGRECNATKHGWYPQIVGTGPGETDSVCGRTGRLFIGGVSRAEIELERKE